MSKAVPSRATLALVFGTLAACAGDDASGIPRDTCIVTSERPGRPDSSVEIRYDAAARRLINGESIEEFDAAGRFVKHYRGNPSSLLWTNYFDEHGAIERSVHSNGQVTTYENTYDGEQLRSVVRTLASGEPDAWIDFKYDDPNVPEVWTWKRERMVAGANGTIETTYDRELQDGRTLRVVERGGLPNVTLTWTRFYDEDLRLEALERDGFRVFGQSADGKPEIRSSWERDAQGRVRAALTDGTEEIDNPVVDGTPDYTQRFSEGCDPLQERFPGLTGEPGPRD